MISVRWLRWFAPPAYIAQWILTATLITNTVVVVANVNSRSWNWVIFFSAILVFNVLGVVAAVSNAHYDRIRRIIQEAQNTSRDGDNQ